MAGPGGGGTAIERTLLRSRFAVAGIACVGLGLTGVRVCHLDAALTGDVGVLASYVRFVQGD